MYQPYYFFPLPNPVQLILAGPFFLLADLLHIEAVGRHAGYSPLLESDLPQGPPVLQLIHPLPLFLLNHP